MEHMQSPELSRRSLIGACIGAAAMLMETKGAGLSAPPPETNGGGSFCAAPPTEAGVLRLENIHEEAQLTEEVDRFEVAERYGLTLVPHDVQTSLILDELQGTTDAYMGAHVVSGFTEKWFGFPTTLNTDSTDEFATKLLNDPVFSGAYLSAVVRNLSILPLEFYQAIKFSHLHIEDVPSDRSGDYNLSSGLIRLDPTVLGTPSVLYHELGHAANMTACGVFEDSALISTMPEEVNYTDDWKTQPGWQGVFADPYGRKNEYEDAATVIENWMTGRLGLEDRRKGTPLYDKLAIIMDRFDTLVPGIVQYIEEVVRPEYEHLWVE